MNFDYKGHELFISQIQDQIRLCNFRYKRVMTSFLTPVEQEIVKQITPNSLCCSMYGGHEDAQRKVACFSQYEDDYDYEIAILRTKLDSRFKEIGHKDCLGALMKLGIEREMLGDLIVEEDQIVIFCKTTMAEYICNECTRIASCNVDFEKVDSIVITKPLTEEILIHSPSLRLDAVISSLAHVSRSDATQLIRKGFVKLNDVVLEQNRQLCNNDFVSIRRCGRFQFKDIKSTTKKGRLILRFDKFI